MNLGVFALLTLIAYGFCLGIVIANEDFWHLAWNSGDNANYIKIARALHDWDAGVIGKTKLFWGTSYAILLVSTLTRMDYGASLLALSLCCGVLSIYLCHQLFGATVAAIFLLVSAPFMQRTLVGGSEPLFTALFLGALLALRKDRLLLAASLGSLAASVRIVGIFVPLTLLVYLIARKDWKRASICSTICGALAVGYSLPMLMLTGTPFGNVTGYSTDWHDHRTPLSIPILPIIQNALTSHEPIVNTIKIAAWAGGVLGIVIYRGFLRGCLKKRLSVWPVETAACLVFIIFCYSYNSIWAWSEFPRFITPVLPFVLTLVPITRLHRGALIASAFVSGSLGAIQIVGMRKLIHWLMTIHG